MFLLQYSLLIITSRRVRYFMNFIIGNKHKDVGIGVQIMGKEIYLW